MIKDALRSVYHALPPRIGEPIKYWYGEQVGLRELKREARVSAEQIQGLSLQHDGEKILIDCGFNSGFVLAEMLEKLPDFEAYGFEINEDEFVGVAELLKCAYSNILSLDFAAVSDRYGSEDFFEMGSERGTCPMLGSTIIEGLDPERSRAEKGFVPSIDFSSFLHDAFSNHCVDGKEPFLAVKMDIEGAEYDVLEAIIADGTIDYVKHLSVEFHARRYPEGKARDEIVEREGTIRAQLAEHQKRGKLFVNEWV